MKYAIIFLCALFIAVSPASAQAPDYGQLDPKPYDPATEPDIDLFMGSWKETNPHHVYGSLIERDILTPCLGDPLKPVRRGAALTNLKAFTHGALPCDTSTVKTTLTGEQRIFYVHEGKGVIKTAKTTAEIFPGIGVLVPPNVEFTFTSTGDVPLGMYILTENLPDGFTPKKDIVVKNENILPFASSNVHWTHCYKSLMTRNDGLATLRGIGPVWFNPMTMGQPHSHPDGTEEIWFSLYGDITVLLGKQIRKFPAGMAYKVPPNGKTPHSNINDTDEMVKVFWLMN